MSRDKKSFVLSRWMGREFRKLIEETPTWGQSALAANRGQDDLMREVIARTRELRELMKAFPSDEEVTEVINRSYESANGKA